MSRNEYERIQLFNRFMKTQEFNSNVMSQFLTLFSAYEAETFRILQGN